MDYERVLKQIGKNITEMRSQNNLSQAQLSNIAKVDRSYLCRVEKGEENLTLGYIIKIAKGLKMPLRKFIKDI